MYNVYQNAMEYILDCLDKYSKANKSCSTTLKLSVDRMVLQAVTKRYKLLENDGAN